MCFHGYGCYSWIDVNLGSVLFTTPRYTVKTSLLFSNIFCSWRLTSFQVSLTTRSQSLPQETRSYIHHNWAFLLLILVFTGMTTLTENSIFPQGICVQRMLFPFNSTWSHNATSCTSLHSRLLLLHPCHSKTFVVSPTVLEKLQTP